MELARGAGDYLLLIDADMTLDTDGDLPVLHSDAYMLHERGALDFGVLRLVRGDRKWWYEGSTHEYLCTDGRFTQEELEGVRVVHHADGSSRDGKLLDLGLLNATSPAGPTRRARRSALAQTYHDLGQRGTRRSSGTADGSSSVGGRRRSSTRTTRRVCCDSTTGSTRPRPACSRPGSDARRGQSPCTTSPTPLAGTGSTT